jgi:hypothetical protein
LQAFRLDQDTTAAKRRALSYGKLALRSVEAALAEYDPKNRIRAWAIEIAQGPSYEAMERNVVETLVAGLAADENTARQANWIYDCFYRAADRLNRTLLDPRGEDVLPKEVKDQIADSGRLDLVQLRDLLREFTR